MQGTFEKILQTGNLSEIITFLLDIPFLKTPFMDADLKNICSFVQEVMEDDNIRREMREALLLFTKWGHILVDDLLDGDYATLPHPYSFIETVVTLMEFFKRENPEKVIWLAVDPYKAWFAHNKEDGKEHVETVERS